VAGKVLYVVRVLAFTWRCWRCGSAVRLEVVAVLFHPEQVLTSCGAIDNGVLLVSKSRCSGCLSASAWRLPSGWRLASASGR
jgi:hypothetical protein